MERALRRVHTGTPIPTESPGTSAGLRRKQVGRVGEFGRADGGPREPSSTATLWGRSGATGTLASSVLQSPNGASECRHSARARAAPCSRGCSYPCPSGQPGRGATDAGRIGLLQRSRRRGAHGSRRTGVGLRSIDLRRGGMHTAHALGQSCFCSPSTRLTCTTRDCSRNDKAMSTACSPDRTAATKQLDINHRQQQ